MNLPAHVQDLLVQPKPFSRKAHQINAPRKRSGWSPRKLIYTPSKRKGPPVDLFAQKIENRQRDILHRMGGQGRSNEAFP